MSKQLKLTEQELEAIGFVRKEYFDRDESDPDRSRIRVIYEINGLNSKFYCNLNEENYAWYYETVIGSSSNGMHLNIVFRPELFIILSAFNINYKFIV